MAETHPVVDSDLGLLCTKIWFDREPVPPRLPQTRRDPTAHREVPPPTAVSLPKTGPYTTGRPRNVPLGHPHPPGPTGVDVTKGSRRPCLWRLPHRCLISSKKTAVDLRS